MIYFPPYGDSKPWTTKLTDGVSNAANSGKTLTTFYAAHVKPEVQPELRHSKLSDNTYANNTHRM
jgi:hypothetical protein